jgi:AcrR family transcriptional regulator
MTKTKEEVLREKILTGAARLFQKFGLEKTTIEDIAREAGKGKSTLYYYFRSKEDIFDAIIKEENEQFFAVLQQAVSDAPTAIRKLDIFWRSRLENLKYRANLYNVIVQEGIEALRTGRGGATARHRVQHDNKETSILKSIFQFGIVSGEFYAWTGNGSCDSREDRRGSPELRFFAGSSHEGNSKIIFFVSFSN